MRITHTKVSIGDVELESVDVGRVAVVAPAPFADDTLLVAAHIVDTNIDADPIDIVAARMVGKEVVQLGAGAADNVLAGVDVKTRCSRAEE